MPPQFDEPVSRRKRASRVKPPDPLETLAGLFENELDARQALLHLRKHDVPAAAISIVMCVHESDERQDVERGALAREIDAAGLHSLADWLVGFTTLTVPERGIFLVAGPLGASLAGGLGVEDDDDGSHAIEALLRHVGFSSDEAGYMDSRLASGSLFASVTTRDRDILMDAVKVFSDDSAVYIPRAVTSDLAAEAAFRLLEFPPEASTNGNVVVTDVAARFFRYCESGRAGWEYEDARGRQVVDPEGRDVGEIVDFIAQTIADGDEPAGRDEVRYAIIAFGGILGISKRHAAIPITQFELGEEPIRINASRDVLRDAPAYDHDTPFSRRVELAVCDYFGAQPYWTNAR